MDEARTVSRPVILDLCCGRVGGAAPGYQQAGWQVVGVDVEDCPDYAGDVFRQGDALDLLPGMITEFRPVALHASPPCPGEGFLAQGTMPSLADRHPHLIEPIRDLFDATGLPYVIENVGGSPVERDVELCGEMFGLGVLMHRKFELGGWAVARPRHVEHRGYVRGWRHGVYRDGPYVAAYGDGGGKATVEEMRTAKCIDWSTDHLGLRDAIPPAYTEWIGERLLAHVREHGPTRQPRDLLELLDAS
jgi:hypothetical protein